MAHNMKNHLAHIRDTRHHTTKSYRLAHWFGKRVIFRRRAVIIKEARLDRDGNFICWVARGKGGVRHVVCDPRFRPSLIPPNNY